MTLKGQKSFSNGQHSQRSIAIGKISHNISHYKTTTDLRFGYMILSI